MMQQLRRQARPSAAGSRRAAQPSARCAASFPRAAVAAAATAPRPPSSRARNGPASRPSPAARAADGSGDKGSGSDGKDAPPLPPWARSERDRDAAAAAAAAAGKKGGGGLPWPLYLVFSFLVATASVGSIFEYANGNSIFGVLEPSSPLWAPVLGLFALTGLPTAAALFFQGVTAANKSFEAQDRSDGYL